MPLARYFKQGQKILLHTRNPEILPGRREALSVFLHNLGPGYLDLLLPYGSQKGEEYPFASEMPLEIHSETMGLGIRLSGTFHRRRGSSLIRVKVQNDLRLFQRSISPRLDLRTGLRYTRGRGTLRSFRDQWEKNVQILNATSDHSKIPPFPNCQLNLSSGGIRFSLTSSPEIADLCLLLLDLGNDGGPICTLAEVVWVKGESGGSRHTAGMRFISILESDQQKIDRLVKKKSRLTVQ